ncbi:hypothetical protein N7490_005133 [Penicillium lividum]|nr:hypothetical protein N7490_005133 [Penicillium lividum]
MPSKKIALVICSTREPRLNPFIARYVLDIALRQNCQESIDVLDLGEQGLPLYNEPAVPSQLPETDPTPHYTHQHTQAWSATVRQYSAFIFVTPQYNWSVPASLKNALDYLYFEWKGKPAAIVSYGGRGGGKAADHLQGILQGLRMKVVSTTPGLVVQTTTLESCVEEQQIGPGEREMWRESGVEEQISSMFLELVEKIQDE